MTAIFDSTAQDINTAITESIAIVELTPEGVILHANELFSEIMGYHGEELIGQNHHNLIPFKDRKDEAYKQIWKDLLIGKRVSGEFKRVTKDHKEVWLRTTFTPINGDEGEVVRIIKTALDVTSEKELSSAYEEQLRAIKKSNATIDFNLDGTIISANENFLELTGYSHDEVIGKNHRIFLPDDLAKSSEYRLFWEDLSRGKFKSGEFLRVTKDGRKIWIRGSYNPIRDHNGKMVKVKKFALDVTREKKLSLHHEQTFRAIDRSTALAEFDLEGNIIRVNKNILALTGYSEQEVIGCHHSIFVSDAYAKTYAYRAFWQDLATGQALSGEFQRFTKFGEELWIQGSYNPIFDHQGVPYKVVKVALDITHQKQAEALISNKNLELDEALRIANQATRSKSEFLANMSHEIRTPLNAIIGMADILSDTELTTEQQRFVNIFQKAGDNLLEIINDILDISKIDAGRINFEQIPFDLEGCIEDVMDLIAPRAHSKGLEVTFDYDPDLPHAFLGDPTRFKQIITNLMGNALKFTEKGQISLMVRENTDPARQGTLYVSVKDTGKGISSEGISHLFEKFSQEDSSITRKYGGTGLGLSLCKRFVELFGGEIWVDSTVSKGSDFQFTLDIPVADCQSVRQKPLDLSLTGKRVLVIDNNSTNRMIIARFFRNEGCTILEAEQGRAGITVLENEIERKTSVDLIIVDGKMPIMDGFEFSRIVKKHPLLNGIPIIMVTSDNYDDDSAKARQMGASEYLTKPIKAGELAKAVMRTLRPAEITLTEEPTAQVAAGGDFVTEALLRSLKVLIVDDSENNRILLKNYLGKKGIAFDVAENGQIAVDKVKEGGFDVVLMDMQMPVMDGFTATAAIRTWEEEQGLKSIEIVALTAMVLQDEVKNCFNAGCDFFLAKPVKKKDLFTLLAKLPSVIAKAPEAKAPEAKDSEAA